MRLRNIKGSKEFIENSPYVIGNPESMPGKWRDFFGNSNPIHIEIGMGKGQFILAMAAANPQINYIGIEMYSSVLYRALEKRDEVELDNITFMRVDAKNLQNIFAPGEVDQIYLNFSDPWPKERHAKRRLTSPQFFQIYNSILKADGIICFKTDNRDLFDFSLESIGESDIWETTDVTFDLHNSEYNEGNIMTEYEARFSSQGMPIHRLVAKRK